MAPNLQKGSTMPRYQVYYARRPTFRPSGECGTPHLTVTGLQAGHAYLCRVEAGCLDDAFRQMQGENWSPHGEARELLRSLGLGHTSMSVGDVLQDEEGVCWECLDQGWRPLANETHGDDRHGPG
jgi:hypothetical protein